MEKTLKNKIKKNKIGDLFLKKVEKRSENKSDKSGKKRPGGKRFSES